MTDLHARIAAIQLRHLQDDLDRDLRKCACGVTTETFEDQAAHVADMLIQELGLREEWTWTWPKTDEPDTPKWGVGLVVDTREEAIAEGDGRCRPAVRYITGGVPGQTYTVEVGSAITPIGRRKPRSER